MEIPLVDGRHINLTSKDLEQIQTFSKVLQLKNKIGIKKNSVNSSKRYYQIQFGNVEFYRFLLDIGLMPNKSKIVGELRIPDIYFADFLRGHLDGDGYTYSYWDKRWKSSFMFYTGFYSASKSHIEWIGEKIKTLYGIKGAIKHSNNSVYQLLFAKKSSILLMGYLYYSHDIPCLTRKRFKIEQQLGIIRKRGRGEMVDAQP